MGRYTDDEIRSFPKITCKIAADYLGISPMAVSIGMRNELLPIGFAIKNEDRFSESWSYQIIDERHEKVYRIRAYIKAVENTPGQNAVNDDTSAWIDWAKGKADWYDPIVAREDVLLGCREHEKSEEQKLLKKSGRHLW
ncbi:hypothetical protein [Sporosarcina limicola]|uniref:Uncharacterized protein n=1 Tax=Sporosarcina limicola TaxID=34101 RepID=A0A927ML95_9BACL|nr:hypothetical protein [Sporosarcina limicola]MBE1555996.1 hypothetical protein [Sporosarcina limicola]